MNKKINLHYKVLLCSLFLIFVFYTNKKFNLVSLGYAWAVYLAFSLFLLYYTYWRVLKENKNKLHYYFVEFLIIIFGVYALILIKESIQDILSNLTNLSILTLIFVALVILLDLREILKQPLHQNH